ncbi:unnamed protein product [Trifolium pratense]|uniref:Uncharacterized protein n=1 Tax=Trifolium pratense TaxID=57577 RepID=A0ACB0KYB4_TRIPR|nr:unnamed protein product [Trifolium pratense]
MQQNNINVFFLLPLHISSSLHHHHFTQKSPSHHRPILTISPLSSHHSFFFLPLRKQPPTTILSPETKTQSNEEVKFSFLKPYRRNRNTISYCSLSLCFVHPQQEKIGRKLGENFFSRSYKWFLQGNSFRLLLTMSEASSYQWKSVIQLWK